MFNSTLKNNIAANFAGSFWQALMGLVFVPLYIKFMGIESYGLIGLFTTLQVIFGLLDVGLGSTLTREMARLSVLPEKKQEMRNLVRTLETVYWGIAVVAGVAIMSLSSIIARYWIKPGQLPPGTIEQALLLMGLVMVFQMPGGFYAGGLRGLQKQVLLNGVIIFTGTLRGAGVVLILWAGFSDHTGFFAMADSDQRVEYGSIRAVPVAQPAAGRGEGGIPKTAFFGYLAIHRRNQRHHRSRRGPHPVG